MPAPRRRRQIPIVVLVLVAAATVVTVVALVTRDSDESAEEAMLEVLELSRSGQGGRLYDMLHPAQQALIGRDDFMSCANQELIRYPQMRQAEAEITETYPETIQVPGTDQRAEVTALVVDMQVQDQELTDTMYVARIDGTWRWINTRISEEYIAACTGP